MVHRERDAAKSAAAEVPQRARRDSAPAGFEPAVTAALQTSYPNPTTITVNDPLSQYLDVASCNEYVGWYDGPPEKIDSLEWRVNSNKPFVISEFGADAQAGRHGDKSTIWNEEFQADVYQRQIQMFRRISNLSGTIAWVLVDFRSPRRPLAGIQDFFNRKGLYSDRGERKAAFSLLRDYYEALDPLRRGSPAGAGQATK